MYSESTSSTSSDDDQPDVVKAKVLRLKKITERKKRKAHSRKNERKAQDTNDPVTATSSQGTPNKQLASKSHSVKKLRKRITEHLAENESLDSFYLSCVRQKLHKEVKALFAMMHCDVITFEINAKDIYRKSPLVIAVYNRDEAMIKLLLKNKVQLEDSIFHAIDSGYYDGLCQLLPKDYSDRNMEIENNDCFHKELTPMMLAARNNNYDILRLLYERGHRLNSEIQTNRRNLEMTIFNENLSEATASPAYITLKAEVEKNDVFEYCLKEIQKLRDIQSKHDGHFAKFYDNLSHHVENYMCSILDQIRSTNELSAVFEYDKENNAVESSLNLLVKAGKLKLKNFVAHRQSQVALADLSNRSMENILNETEQRSSLFFFGMGFLYPVLSLLYLIHPRSRAGRLLTQPRVLYSCHLVSNLLLALLLLLSPATKNVEHDHLGGRQSTIQILITLWICGIFVQEFEEVRRCGVKDYLVNPWNYPDCALVLIYGTVVALRTVDIIKNVNLPVQITRRQWTMSDSRLWADDLKVFADYLLFLRLFGFTRAYRHLGPLQISMSKMFLDILRFVAIFALVLGSFTIGLTDLYSYYGTDDGALAFCSNLTNTDGNSSCTGMKSLAFSSLPNSFSTLLWTLFGYFELGSLKLPPSHKSTEEIGWLLMTAYHVLAVIVMLNMLIAMMSSSFDETRANEEVEWRFQRTLIWIHYIRLNVKRPPPMNLIPNPWKLADCLSRLRRPCKNRSIIKAYDESPDQGCYNTATLSDGTDFRTYGSGENHYNRRNVVLGELVHRYKLKHHLLRE